jgi:hypothetical protein
MHPPALQIVQDWPIESGCPVCVSLWWGFGLSTVGEVEEAFALVCRDAGERLNDPTGASYFLNHVDSTDRTVMRRELVREVNAVLMERAGLVEAA